MLLPQFSAATLIPLKRPADDRRRAFVASDCRLLGLSFSSKAFELKQLTLRNKQLSYQFEDCAFRSERSGLPLTGTEARIAGAGISWSTCFPERQASCCGNLAAGEMQRVIDNVSLTYFPKSGRPGCELFLAPLSCWSILSIAMPKSRGVLILYVLPPKAFVSRPNESGNRFCGPFSR